GRLYPIAAAVKRDQLFPVYLLPAQVTRAMLNRFSPLSHHVPPLVCLQPAERLALRREPEALSRSKPGPQAPPVPLTAQSPTPSPTWSWLNLQLYARPPGSCQSGAASYEGPASIRNNPE